MQVNHKSCATSPPDLSYLTLHCESYCLTVSIPLLGLNYDPYYSRISFRVGEAPTYVGVPAFLYLAIPVPQRCLSKNGVYISGLHRHSYFVRLSSFCSAACRLCDLVPSNDLAFNLQRPASDGLSSRGSTSTACPCFSIAQSYQRWQISA